MTMKQFKTILTALLILALLLSFAACSGSSAEQNENDTTDATTSASDGTTAIPDVSYEEDDLPDDLNFGGRTVSILSSVHLMPYLEAAAYDITADESAAGTVNQELFNRKKYVEERLGVKIVNKVSLKIDEEKNSLLFSGTGKHQILASPLNIISKNAIGNALLDLKTVENLDLDKPWWSRDFNEKAEMKDKLYFTTGDAALSLMRNMSIVFYNEDLAASYAESSGNDSVTRVYDLVKTGKWTIDELHTIVADVYDDLYNNNSRDKLDVNGLGITNNSVNSIWTSLDLSILKSDGNGWYDLGIEEEKLFDALSKATDLFNTQSAIRESDPANTAIHFAADHLMFTVSDLSSAENVLVQNMSSEYGIIPFPKYDESQADYYTFANDELITFAIPAYTEDLDMVGAVLEALASYGYRNNRPEYLSYVTRGKYDTDPDTRAIMDGIVNNYRTDSGLIYNRTLACDYAYTLSDMVRRYNRSIEGVHKQKSEEILKMLSLYVKN
ncbi:MAG: hypothetical protein IKV54_08295 [Clostridia bacterium]|nr:hypothetical protein [Clostridia bacterium]